MFIRVLETQYNDKPLININHISAIYEESNTIVVNGNHGQGNGIYHLDSESMKKLLKNIELINEPTGYFESNGSSLGISHNCR